MTTIRRTGAAVASISTYGPARDSGRNGHGCDPAPGCVTRLVERFETLAILDRVHWAKESLVRERHQLTLFDQPGEGFLHELVPGLDEIENAPLQHEEASVDPDL